MVLRVVWTPLTFVILVGRLHSLLLSDAVMVYVKFYSSKCSMKGTQLKHLDDDYQQTEQTIDQLETESATLDQGVEHYQKDAASKSTPCPFEKRDPI